MRSTRHSLSDVLDGTVDPAVLALLRAGIPIYYYCYEAGCTVEERPDGTVWRVNLGPDRQVSYLNNKALFRNV
jgi:hypothetical protein